MKKVISLLLMVGLFFSCTENKKRSVSGKVYLEVKYNDNTMDTLDYRITFESALEKPIIHLNDKGCLLVGKDFMYMLSTTSTIACDVRTWRLLKVEEDEDN